MIEIQAVIGGVLRNEYNLLHTLRRKVLDLALDVFHAAGNIVPADGRDSTERTAVVAALRDLDVGGVARRRQHAMDVLQIMESLVRIHDALARHALAHDLRDFFHLANAEERIYLRHLRRKLLGVALGQAARHDQRLQVILFVFRHFQNRVDGFLLSRFDKAAGIDNDGVGLGRIGFQLETIRKQHAQQPGGKQHPRGTD